MDYFRVWKEPLRLPVSLANDVYRPILVFLFVWCWPMSFVIPKILGINVPQKRNDVIMVFIYRFCSTNFLIAMY